MKLIASSFQVQFKTFKLLHKVAMFISKFRITAKEITWLVTSMRSSDWLNFNDLPIDSAQPAAPFDAWLHLAGLLQLRDSLPAGEIVLSEMFALAWDPTTTENGLLRRLSELLQWELKDLRFLAGIQVFGFIFPEAYRDERALARLLACFRMMKSLGASSEQCNNWRRTNLTATDAQSIKNAIKAKYETAIWLEKAKPLRDLLRDQQRAALVDYHVANPLRDSINRPLWKDANGLYGYYLIDVEMSSCMETSRLKQAISSVQLFIQRCLMSLERGVNLEPDETEEWSKWRKQYRIWEANRKVFLYPENWIEPELRDDKSPFFKELEAELLQMILLKRVPRRR